MSLALSFLLVSQPTVSLMFSCKWSAFCLVTVKVCNFFKAGFTIMCLGMVFLPFLLKFIEILESHWLISLISLKRFPTTILFSNITFIPLPFLLLYNFNYIYIKSFHHAPFTLLYIFIFYFFVCVIWKTSISLPSNFLLFSSRV